MKRVVVGLLVLALAFPMVVVAAEKKKEVVVCAWGGRLEKAMREAWFDPFEKETGIKVVSTASPSVSKVKAMVQSGNVEWDLVAIAGGIMTPLLKQGLLEKIDYSKIDQKLLNQLYPEARHPFGVGGWYFSIVMAYSTITFPRDTYPKNWAEFWDVKKFPGPRTLLAMQDDGSGWEFALLADGVPLDKVYNNPDMDRAFRKYKEIKPHIAKFWTQATETGQMLVDKEIVVGSGYNGRIQDLKEQGAPVDYHWNQGKLYLEYLCVPKGAPNYENALKFAAFQARADRQAALWKTWAYGPVNQEAFKLLPQERHRLAPSYPDNKKKQFFVSDDWFGANAEKTIERWNKWILEK